MYNALVVYVGQQIGAEGQANIWAGDLRDATASEAEVEVAQSRQLRETFADGGDVRDLSAARKVEVEVLERSQVLQGLADR